MLNLIIFWASRAVPSIDFYGATTFRITTFSITALSLKGITCIKHIEALHYVCCAKCHILFIVMLSAIMLNVVILSAIMLNVVGLSVVAPTQRPTTTDLDFAKCITREALLKGKAQYG